jgi:Superinfection immunity protein
MSPSCRALYQGVRALLYTSGGNVPFVEGTMGRLALRAGAWALAGTVVITLAAGCGASTQAPPGQGPGRQIFTMKMVTNHRRLDRGVLAYSALTTMQAQQAATFEVQVTDVGRGPETTAFTRQAHGWVIDAQNVPTGGTVSVKVGCSAGLTCVPRASSPRQVIQRPGRSATWTWDITARSPGDNQMVITAVSYRGDSSVVASQTSVAALVKVQTTPLYRLEAAFDARKSAVIFVAADLLVLAAILATGLVVRRRMARGRPASSWTAGLARRPKARPDQRRTAPPELGEIAPPELGEIAPPELDGTARPGPRETAPPEPDGTARPGPRETAPPEPDGTARPGPRETAPPGLGETARPGPRETAPPGLGETARPGPRGAAPPELGGTARPGPRGAAPPELGGTARVGLGRRAWRGLCGWARLGRAWLGPRARAWLGPRARPWLGLAAIEVAVAALVITLVRATTTKPVSFAIIAAAAAVVLLPVYFLPVFIARARRVPDLAPVTVINIFLGWTFFGWVTALALAVRDRRPERPAAPAPRAAVPDTNPEPLAYAAYAAVPRMRPAPTEPAGAAVTLMLWQTPDGGLTCQDPGDSWVRRWTYGVSPGQDGAPRFVLTGEQHGCLVPPTRERPGR